MCAHPLERARVSGCQRDLAPGEEVHVGKLVVKCLHIPGHTDGQLAFHLPAEKAVFTGDTLFKGSIGGTRGPGHTTFALFSCATFRLATRASRPRRPGDLRCVSVMTRSGDRRPS